MKKVIIFLSLVFMVIAGYFIAEYHLGVRITRVVEQQIAKLPDNIKYKYDKINYTLLTNTLTFNNVDVNIDSAKKINFKASELALSGVDDSSVKFSIANFSSTDLNLTIEGNYLGKYVPELNVNINKLSIDDLNINDSSLVPSFIKLTYFTQQEILKNINKDISISKLVNGVRISGIEIKGLELANYTYDGSKIVDILKLDSYYLENWNLGLISLQNYSNFNYINNQYGSKLKSSIGSLSQLNLNNIIALTDINKWIKIFQAFENNEHIQLNNKLSIFANIRIEKISALSNLSDGKKEEFLIELANVDNFSIDEDYLFHFIYIMNKLDNFKKANWSDIDFIRNDAKRNNAGKELARKELLAKEKQVNFILSKLRKKQSHSMFGAFELKKYRHSNIDKNGNAKIHLKVDNIIRSKNRKDQFVTMDISNFKANLNTNDKIEFNHFKTRYIDEKEQELLILSIFNILNSLRNK